MSLDSAPGVDPAAGARAGIGSAIPLILILALWVAGRPYFGIIHDARLYMVQALQALHPGRYDQDIYFRYGSQDAFTIFTAGYKWLVAWLGPAQAHFAATMAGEALWLAALFALAWAIFPRRAERWLAVGGVVALWARYGGAGVFSYAEPFATPRLFAEALIMAGLACGLRGRSILAAILLVLAGAIHPLAAACGAGVLLVWAAFADRRVWFVIAAVAIAGVLAAALGAGPFARAFSRYDDTWFRVVALRCRFVLITHWSSKDFYRVCATLAVPALVLTRVGGRERRLVAAVLAVTLASLVVSVLGSDLAHNVLITNLQVWRSLWLTTVVANAFLPVMLLRGDVQGWPRALLMSGAVASMLARFFGAMELIAPPLILAACVIAALEPAVSVRWRRGLRLLAMVAVGLGVCFEALILQTEFNLDPQALTDIARACLAAAAVAGLIWSLRRGAGLPLAATAGLLLLAAAAFADGRTDWNRYVYGPAADDGLTQFLAGAGHTYWEGDGVELLWFRQGAPSYYSCLQGSESLFFRGTAMDFARRGAALSRLNTADFAPMEVSFCGRKNNPRASGPTGLGQLAAACRALPDLDTLILERPVPGVPTQVWRAPAWQTQQVSIMGLSTFFRYSCAALR
jgi:hypothetical protein